MRTQPARFLSILIFLLTLPGAAGAQLLFTFDQPILSGAPGATLTFSGTLTNTDPSVIYLNADSSDLSGTGLTLDDSPFLLDAPTLLQPTGDPSGNDTWTGDLFQVDIGTSASPGDYVGSFTILGGGNPNASDALASQYFVVEVQKRSVPEPGLPALLSVFALGAIGLTRRWRSRRARR